MRRALLDKKHSALAKSFLRPLIQFAGIAKLHSYRLSDVLHDVICLLGILVVTATGKRIVFYCAFGERSAMAVQAAQDAGLKTACHIQGGIDAWKKADGPLAR